MVYCVKHEDSTVFYMPDPIPRHQVPQHLNPPHPLAQNVINVTRNSLQHFTLFRSNNKTSIYAINVILKRPRRTLAVKEL